MITAAAMMICCAIILAPHLKYRDAQVATWMLAVANLILLGMSLST